MRNRLAPVGCLVFDIDDTLYLEREYVRSGFCAVGEWIRENQGVESFFEEAWREFEGGRRREIFNVALLKFGIDPSQELIQALLSVYRNHNAKITLLPDSEECLRRVAGKVFIGVISDGAVAGQRIKVGRLGLAARCDHIILTESLGLEYSKPHPRAFMEMQKVANCAPEACVYVADNPVKDFVSPIKLGWRTIRVRRAGGIHCGLGCSEDSQPEAEMDDLNQLPRVLGLS
ncbi:MAG: HAD family hydrolase [Acidobacteriaceae bacterium]|nr:HAD family hydrolase [Acidobacteriaceae bacterium]MBV9782143.1 HAD family hydrolase [Acidobacteriaceae bacterium]